MVGIFKTKLLTFLTPTIVKSKFKTSTLTSPQNKLTAITSIAMTVLYTNTMMTNLLIILIKSVILDFWRI